MRCDDVKWIHEGLDRYKLSASVNMVMKGRELLASCATVSLREEVVFKLFTVVRI